MNRKLALVGVAVAGLTIASTVRAEAQSYTWTGFYIGGHAGVAWEDFTSAQIADGDKTASPPDVFKYPGGTDTGFFGGAQGGYNFQFNSIIVGFEGDVGGISINDSIRRPAHGNEPDGFDASSVDYGWYGVIAGRLGFALNQTLFYAKGGGAFADIKNRSFEFGDGAIEFDEDHRHSGTAAGWTVGGGIERAFGDRWTGKVEYLHMDFGNEKVRNLEGDTIEFENKADTVKIGFNYRFGGYQEPAPVLK